MWHYYGGSIFDKMRFSMPPVWRGRTVWARYAAPLLRLFDDQERLIRQYLSSPASACTGLTKTFPRRCGT